MNYPLVSIICVCYNQERFVERAIESAVHVHYPNKEIIIVDDASTDGSAEKIKSVISKYANIHFIQLTENRGNCAAFNAGWRKSEGEYTMDLAGDDELDSSALQNGVEAFLTRDGSYGVLHGDAMYMDENGSDLYTHSEKYWKKNVPEGDIYIELIKRYFVSSASMLIRRSVLVELNGYDESLAYEDFDFWIRSSRKFKYFSIPNIQIRKRIVRGSLSSKQFKRGSAQQHSTLRVCEKILTLNKNQTEHDALRERVHYELRHALSRLDFTMAKLYREFLRKIPS